MVIQSPSLIQWPQIWHGGLSYRAMITGRQRWQ
jgi:hypothetical protein